MPSHVLVVSASATVPNKRKRECHLILLIRVKTTTLLVPHSEDGQKRACVFVTSLWLLGVGVFHYSEAENPTNLLLSIKMGTIEWYKDFSRLVLQSECYNTILSAKISD